MNKDELLKIYSAYLPYGLQISTDDEGQDWVETVIGVNNEALETSVGNYWDFTVKPILYDLSYLTKEIEHEGERFIPIRKIYEINGWEWSDDEVNEIDEIGICSDLDILTYATAQLLLSWHFNIFSLPESEYINKATLTQKQ
ncbi:hypothetical protein [Chryseobacterium sp. ON_d1]|uniref:hypothetical protein n=1 Tax=Chryseobacterium sp. ON_d1 TaxID=2583211 RepID=UPI00115813B8|nr:hypothetical protein [Chryseobacterium sp. ON_d1]GEJ46039.1 hypothetical protein CRS_26470 [Chryseobacterium sp. ON_d1]